MGGEPIQAWCMICGVTISDAEEWATICGVATLAGPIHPRCGDALMVGGDTDG